MAEEERETSCPSTLQEMLMDTYTPRVHIAGGAGGGKGIHPCTSTLHVLQIHPHVHSVNCGNEYSLTFTLLVVET
jgi:hypothetical protein